MDRPPKASPVGVRQVATSERCLAAAVVCPQLRAMETRLREDLRGREERQREEMRVLTKKVDDLLALLTAAN